MSRKRKMTLIIIAAVVIVLIIGAVCVLNHPAFGRYPSGKRLARIEQSAHYRDGEFRNLELTPMLTSSKGLLQTWYEALFKSPKDVRPDKPIPAVKTDLNNLPARGNSLVWFGHSSYLLQTDGRRVLVDPVLTTGFPSSVMMKPFKGTDIYSPDDLPAVDLMVITHDHFDHLDYGTVRAIRERVGLVVCPLGVGEHLEYWGYPADKIVEMDWDESTDLPGGFKITCLSSRHFSGRTLKRNKSLWASFMLETPSGATVFIGGDGGYGKHFKSIAGRFPRIDLAILEDGQYNDDWRYIHTMPSQLPDIIHTLHPAKVLAVHNSKFALARHPWREPMDSIRAEARADSSIHLLTPEIGEPVSF